jgi:small redox-active disulfide protein 2
MTMSIEVLGPGCAKCGRLERGVREIVAADGLDAEVTKVTDLYALIQRDVMVPPALVVDGRVVVSGRVPSHDELRRLLVR